VGHQVEQALPWSYAYQDLDLGAIWPKKLGFIKEDLRYFFTTFPKLQKCVRLKARLGETQGCGMEFGLKNYDPYEHEHWIYRI